MVFFNSRNGREYSPNDAATTNGNSSFIEEMRKLTTEFNLSIDEGARRVTLTLGDRSVRDALETFQLASFTHHERFAIRPGALRSWGNDPRIKGVSIPNGRVSVEVVPESAHLSVERQDQLGLNTPTVAELALAGAAFFFVTGKHLFDESACRGADGVLAAGRGGIDEENSTPGENVKNVHASRRVPCI